MYQINSIKYRYTFDQHQAIPTSPSEMINLKLNINQHT